MKLNPLPIHGAWLAEPEPIRDERGLFTRVWCAEEFARCGIAERPVQSNTGWSARRGTLRGLHYQVAPKLEAKIVRCTRGAVYDVIVDLRTQSATYGRWHAEELTAENRRTLYVPPGCAHGYLTLIDGAELEYHATTLFAPEHARGVRYDDPSLRISWPIPVDVVSERDCSWPLLDTAGLTK